MRFAYSHERSLWHRGYRSVAGVDEAGRGAWAGPIVAGAVLLTPKLLGTIQELSWFAQVNDSKLLSPKAREEIFAGLTQAVPWATGVVGSKAIDSIGIGNANRRAVALAVAKLKHKPQYVLVDYVAKIGRVVAGVPARALVDGDAHVFSIALASIVAKAYRDRLMARCGQRYPDYGFAQHKGYGTAQHSAALSRFGPCPAHRRSYRPVADALV